MPSRIDPRLRVAFLVATFAVVAVILYESTQERGRPGVPDLSTNEAYLGHFAVYALMAFCAMVALGPRTLQAFAAVVLIAASLGVSMELYQAQMPSRTASAGDVLADAAGAASGLATYAMLTALLEPPKRSQPTKL